MTPKILTYKVVISALECHKCNLWVFWQHKILSDFVKCVPTKCKRFVAILIHFPSTYPELVRILKKSCINLKDMNKDIYLTIFWGTYWIIDSSGWHIRFNSCKFRITTWSYEIYFHQLFILHTFTGFIAFKSSYRLRTSIFDDV